MDTAPGLGYRDALHPMYTTFVFETTVGPPGLDTHDHLFEPPEPGLVGRKDLRLPPPAFGVTMIHAQEIGRKKSRLLPTGSGPNLHDDVLFVVGVPGQEKKRNLLLQFLQPGLQGPDLLPGQLPEFLVSLAEKFPVFLQFLKDPAIFPIGLHHRLKLRVFPRHPRITLPIRKDLRIRELLG